MEIDAIELAAMRRELSELSTRVRVLETRVESIEPLTQRGTGTPPAAPAPSASPLLDAVGDAFDALGFKG